MATCLYFSIKMPPKPKYLATTQLIDGQPYVVPFAETGDANVTSIVGITGTKAQFDTALDDGAFAFTTACPSITFADAANIVVDTTTGTKIGTAASQKLGFFNATPVTQRTNITEITDNTGASPSNEIRDTGNATANENDATLCERINMVEQLLQDLGLTD